MKRSKQSVEKDSAKQTHREDVGCILGLESEVKSENEESYKIKFMGPKKLLGTNKLSARKRTNTKLDRTMGQKLGE